MGTCLYFPATALLVYAWDLGCLFDVRIKFPCEIVELSHVLLDSIPDSQIRSFRVFIEERAFFENTSESDIFIVGEEWHQNWRSDRTELRGPIASRVYEARSGIKRLHARVSDSNNAIARDDYCGQHKSHDDY